jgi:cytochrome P450
MRQLLSEPSRWRALCADPSLIPGAVEEGLRVDSPVSAIMRTTTRKVAAGGVELPAGARLFLLLGSANTDERRFPDADGWRLNRTGQAPHLAFGRVSTTVSSRRSPGWRPRSRLKTSPGGCPTCGWTPPRT